MQSFGLTFCRMKSLHYIATVVNSYRKIIDEYEKNHNVEDFDYYINQISKAENRLTSTGFLFNEPTVEQELYDLNLSVPTKDFIGIVKGYEDGMLIVEVRNYFLPNTTIEVFTPNETFDLKIGNIYDLDGNIKESCNHPLEIVKFEGPKLDEYSLLRLK